MATPPKILIVDDDRFAADYLEQDLEDLGYRTERASDGLEALNKVSSAAPDLILLDVVMPVMDGFTVCRLLKGNDDTRLIPIIVMTALDGVEDRIKAIELGADDVLVKPVNERHLMARIHTALRLKATMDTKLREAVQIKEHLAKFVPERVRQLVIANPDSPGLRMRDQDVTVLILDISGYTRLCEALPPARVNELLEQYFSSFLDCILSASADITDFAGDGFLAILRDADPRAHAIRAAALALTLQTIAQDLNRKHSDSPIGIHLGISTGLALVGSSRLESAHGTRFIFRASGMVTNLAARLAALAEEGQTLLGPETVQRLSNRFIVEDLGPRPLKNIAEPVVVHRLIDVTRSQAIDRARSSVSDAASPSKRDGEGRSTGLTAG
jgi:adenylate cyclase